MIKSVYAPALNRSFKLGRTRPRARAPRLSLKNYLMRSLPAPPAAVDYSKAAYAGLHMILGNDATSDCTAAGIMHIEDIWRGNVSGASQPVSADEAIAFYSASTGYVPGDSTTDQGGNEIDVMNYAMQHGLFADGSGKIAGYVAINGADPDEVKTALWLFENVYFGVEMPDRWINPIPTYDDWTWDVAGEPDMQNGHAFIGCAYDSAKVRICSWGMTGFITFEAIAKYATTPNSGELFAILSKDAIDKASGKAPSGFDFTQLSADLQALGG